MGTYFVLVPAQFFPLKVLIQKVPVGDNTKTKTQPLTFVTKDHQLYSLFYTSIVNKAEQYWLVAPPPPALH